MKILLATATGTGSVLATGVAMAQNANMMNGGVWNDGWMGGYGGVGMPLLLVIVIAGLVAWIASRSGK